MAAPTMFPFSKAKQRTSCIITNPLYVWKIVMILLHGQSSIERGFSIKKEILGNNLQEKSLISQCLLHDHFTSENIVLHDHVIPQALKKVASYLMEDTNWF